MATGRRDFLETLAAGATVLACSLGIFAVVLAQDNGCRFVQAS